MGPPRQRLQLRTVPLPPPPQESAPQPPPPLRPGRALLLRLRRPPLRALPPLPLLLEAPLLLHGFPELAYSWRKVMPSLAEAGYHVIAPDQRGYGRTTGWDADYDGDLASFRLPNLVRDALGLVHAFGYRAVDAVIGHDFGSSVAACAH